MAKTIVVKADSYVPAVNQIVVASKSSPAIAISTWGKEHGLSEINQKFCENKLTEILGVQAKLRQNFFELGSILSQLKSRLGEAFGEFATAVLPTVGISRSVAYTLVARVETMTVKFPHPAVRAFLLDSDARGIVDSQTCNLKPEYQKVLDEVGICESSKKTPEALAYAEQFMAKVKKLRSKPATPDGQKKAAQNRFSKKRESAIGRLNNYLASMEKLEEMDNGIAADGYAEDIEALFEKFIQVASPDKMSRLSGSLERIAARHGKTTTPRPAPKATK